MTLYRKYTEALTFEIFFLVAARAAAGAAGSYVNNNFQYVDNNFVYTMRAAAGAAAA